MTDNNMRNVLEAFDVLLKDISSYKENVWGEITFQATEKNISRITILSDKLKKIESFYHDVDSLKNKWVKFNDQPSESNVSNSDEDLSGVGTSTKARTKWYTTNDGDFHIDTERVEGPAYSNVFSVDLFKTIATTIADMIDQKGSVKTTEVVNKIGDEIINRSEYKKTPRMPVYATMKVLMKEGLIDTQEGNSHKYIFAKDKADIISWLNTL